MRVFTDPQRKALLWLKPNFECSGGGREFAGALFSLKLYHRDLVGAKWKTIERGRRYLAYMLTDLGVAVRAEIVAADARA